MQLQPDCLKPINTHQARYPYSAADAAVATGEWPETSQLLQKGSQRPPQKVQKASPSNHGRGENVTSLLGDAFSFVPNLVRNMPRYFRWQVPLEQGTTDILSQIILCCGGCPVHCMMFSKIPGLSQEMTVVGHLGNCSWLRTTPVEWGI